MNLLITGVRAPGSLEIARLLDGRGNRLIFADSVSFPLSRWSNRVSKFYRVAPPNPNLESFVNDIAEIVKKESIDLVIPLCEEIFWLAAKRERLGAKLFCPPFDLIHRLHHKEKLREVIDGCSALFPETELITEKDSLVRFESELEQWVFKPAYSRFADQTLISPGMKPFSRIAPTRKAPWVAQRKMTGKEFSSFSVARAGKVMAHVCYFSEYRAGVGAGIYLESAKVESIERFVRELVSKYQFDGQIGFDFILDENEQLFVIECNPRGTSGWHFLVDAGFGFENELLEIEEPESHSDQRTIDAGIRKMVAFAMPVWGLASSIRNGKLGSLIPDCFRASDVIFRWNDPLPAIWGTPISLIELLSTAVFRRMTPQQASTIDFEFNGLPDEACK